jgi:hypothetical protein
VKLKQRSKLHRLVISNSGGKTPPEFLKPSFTIKFYLVERKIVIDEKNSHLTWRDKT